MATALVPEAEDARDAPSSTAGPPPSPPTPSAFRKDIQGLRALAVTLVILAHADVPHCAAGIVGVDVFFVISGYVITGSLVRETGSIKTRLLSFYSRRVRRILPAATLTLLATLVATYHYLGAITGRGLGTDERWASFFAANWHFILSSENYFSSQQPPSIVLHFWSLAVEEQFYLVFPLFLFIVWQVAPARHRNMIVLVALGLLVVSSSWWCIHEIRLPDPRAAAAVGWLGLGGICLSCVFLSTTNYPGVAVFWPVGATALVLWAGTTSTGRGPELLLSTRPVVYVGDISYSLYLWHYPFLVIPLQYSVSASLSPLARLELITAAVGVASFSYFLVENPIRRSKWLRAHRPVVFLMGLCLVGSVWLLTGLLRAFVSV
jgi:peptidoglycan/LPS O-acetylase OafA/YrhL